MKSALFLLLLVLLSSCHTTAPRLLPQPAPVTEPKAIATPAAPAPATHAALEQRLRQQRQMIEALMSQNDALTAKLNAPASTPHLPPPKADDAPPTPPAMAVAPRIIMVENPAPSIPVALPTTSPVTVLAPNADGVIDLAVLSSPPSEPVNPFAVRHLPADAVREVTLRLSGTVGGPVPAALVNGRVLQLGEAVESFMLESCEADAALFRRGDHLIRLPISVQPVRIRVAL